jgi:hypothetical protein
LLPLCAGDRFQYAENVAATRAALGADRLTSALRAGRQMPLEHAVQYALSSEIS